MSIPAKHLDLNDMHTRPCGVHVLATTWPGVH